MCIQTGQMQMYLRQTYSLDQVEDLQSLFRFHPDFLIIAHCIVSRVDKSKSVELLVTAVDWKRVITDCNQVMIYYNVMLAPLTRNHTC